MIQLYMYIIVYIMVRPCGWGQLKSNYSNINKDEDNEADGDDMLTGFVDLGFICAMSPASLNLNSLQYIPPPQVISHYVHHVQQINQFKAGIIYLHFTTPDCILKLFTPFDHHQTFHPKCTSRFSAGEYYHNPSTGVSIWENPTHCTSQLSSNRMSPGGFNRGPCP